MSWRMKVAIRRTDSADRCWWWCCVLSAEAPECPSSSSSSYRLSSYWAKLLSVTWPDCRASMPEREEETCTGRESWWQLNSRNRRAVRMRTAAASSSLNSTTDATKSAPKSVGPTAGIPGSEGWGLRIAERDEPVPEFSWRSWRSREQFDRLARRGCHHTPCRTVKCRATKQ